MDSITVYQVGIPLKSLDIQLTESAKSFIFEKCNFDRRFSSIYDFEYGADGEMKKSKFINNNRLCLLTACLAAKHGNIEILELLFTHAVLPLNKLRIVDFAIKSGKVDTVQWLINHGARLCAYHSRTAIQNADIPMLTFLFFNRCPFDKHQKLFMSAVKSGSVRMLEFMHSCGFLISSCHSAQELCLEAAKTGKLDILKWLREKKCPWSPEECKQEAIRKDFHCVVEWIDSQF